MRPATRLLGFAAAALAALACKGDEKTGPQVTPISRSLLNGTYFCAGFDAFFVGTAGPNYYSGTCQAYAASTNPSRRDSIELAAFAIGETNELTRLDFPPATIVYDSTRNRLIATATDGRVDTMFAAIEAGRVVLVQRFKPFDFSGDQVADTLVLVYQRQ